MFIIYIIYKTGKKINLRPCFLMKILQKKKDMKKKYLLNFETPKLGKEFKAKCILNSETMQDVLNRLIKKYTYGEEVEKNNQ